MRALFGVAMLLLGACGQRPAPSVIESPAASAAMPAPSHVTATATAIVPSSPSAASGVQAEPLGAVIGEWIFVLSAVPPQPNVGIEDHEIWAISADGRTSKRIVRYRPVWGGPVNRLGAVTNNLARQISPDGRKLVVAASASAGAGPYRIFSVDLLTGAIAQLTQDVQFTDLEPLWSPDGSLIAFSRFSADREERDLWLMQPDGKGHRSLATNVGSLFTFTPDGRDVCFAQNSRYVCAEVSSGRLRELSGGVLIPRPIGSGVPSAWRVGAPAFVGAFGSPARIEIADGIALRQRTLTTSLFGDVRWRPGMDEILVVTTRGDDWGAMWSLRMDGTSRRIPTDLIVRRAEWSSDGRSVVTIAAEARHVPLPPALPPATSLHRVDPERGAAVEIFRPVRQSGYGLFDVATIVYR
jgi:hypothetical protein